MKTASGAWGHVCPLPCPDSHGFQRQRSHSLSAQLLVVQPVHTLPSPGRIRLPGSPGVILCPAGPERLTRKGQQQLCLWDQCHLTRSPSHLDHLTRLEVLGQAR